MRIAALIAYGLICIPGFMIGIPFVVHILFWPFDESRWPVMVMMFLTDLAIAAAIFSKSKKRLKFRKLIECVAFLILCVPIVYVYLFTKGEVINSPFFVLPSLAFIVMYIWSVFKQSSMTPGVFQKECCKEA